MMIIKYKPIGTIHTPFKKPRGTPIQTSSPKAQGTQGTIEVFAEYAPALKDLDGFSHIIVLYHFHLSQKPSLTVTPYMDQTPRGLFATRAPSRPNPIGMSVLRLLNIKGNNLHVSDVDILDGTPLLDIKPFVPGFDSKEVEKIGWLENNIQKLGSSTDDGRFKK